ncbi:histidine phosphatase family protein [Planotetraspora kaengkrachanensis]|uniref:phosphoglycerate mutase (2,3-diphosphoglycerate-dependent) n=1 Tax=Planotetraspora kaengkrachanensis TaxID=575193 RepID=A0A8J3Q1W5_9ACTN|nr:histidine phosphatase family protein [Planotetraspora kaengkrachanensis]GIG85012.1 phosphoglycerate mutase [Planotetraspora kaengkrachanensis]
MTVSFSPCGHAESSGPVVLRALRHGQSTANHAWAVSPPDPAAAVPPDGVSARPGSAASFPSGGVASSLADPAATFPADDMKIALTDLGRRQAADVGRWLSAPDRVPDVVWCSPYLRAGQTWSLARRELIAAGRSAPCERVDARLRDRHRGLLHHLRPAEVRERFPEEAAREEREGMLRYRPPDGESFVDVAARLRVVWRDIRGDLAHQRVLVVAHDAVVLFLRQIIEDLPGDEIERIAAAGLAGNGSVTTWERQEDGFRLACYDFRDHLGP